jgi:Holliday junction DNA helicase RuvA
MYAFIKGNLVEKTPANAVILTGGVGYFLNITLNTYSKIKDVLEVKLYTHLVVREDALILFGFADEEEREVFRKLITVSGVGANTARIILSSLTPDELYNAISSNNVAVLQSVKGIGLKSAQRIIVDLKDKLSSPEHSAEILGISHNTIKDEALSALTMLGFNKRLAEKTLDKILDGYSRDKNMDLSNISVEDLIKQALKLL